MFQRVYQRRERENEHKQKRSISDLSNRGLNRFLPLEVAELEKMKINTLIHKGQRRQDNEQSCLLDPWTATVVHQTMHTVFP